MSKLDFAQSALLALAIAARRDAYAPYSGFAVGAAVRTADGRLFSGSNVENASYGLTCCAERVAVFKAVAAGVRRLQEIAIVADIGEPCWPCGACRQVLAEFGPNLLVIAANLRQAIAVQPLSALLPAAFTAAALPTSMPAGDSHE